MFSSKQKKVIFDGFIEYKIKKGFQGKILIESSPTKGVWLDEQFFSEEMILDPFIKKALQIRADRMNQAVNEQLKKGINNENNL